MNTPDLDDAIRDVLHRQAALVRPSSAPVPTPEPLAPSADVERFGRAAWRRRSRPFVAIAAGLVVIGAIATSILLKTDDSRVRTADGSTEPAATAEPRHADPATPRFAFESDQVSLSAEDFWVEEGGIVSRPLDEVEVRGDPGDPGRFATLELTWLDRGIEMRANLSFVSDGTDWWSNSVQTYHYANPDAEPEFVGPPGEYFREPVDTAAAGDADIGALHLRGFTLLALPTPEPCLKPSTPIALITERSVSTPVTSLGSGYVVGVDVIDPAKCRTVDPGPYVVSVSSSNPSIADAVLLPPMEGLPGRAERFNLLAHEPGDVVLTFSATDPTHGRVVARTTTSVTVTPG